MMARPIACATLACLLPFLPGTVAKAQTTNGLAAYYPFDGNAHDASGNALDGTAYNGVTYVPGVWGSSCSLNGSAQFTLPSQVPVLIDMTIAFWIKTGVLDANDFPWATFLVSRDICQAHYDWNVLVGRGRKILFHTGTESNEYILATSEDLGSNEWHHVACVADSGNAAKAIFIDGQLDAEVNWDPVAFENGYLQVFVGASSCSTPGHTFFTGGLDELRIYNRVLSYIEIQQLAIAPPPAITSQPQSRTVRVGTNVSFSVTASGVGPLYYQWFLANQALNGQTSASLSLTNVQFADAGNYSVVVSNSFGSITSSNAALVVLLDHFVWGQIGSPQLINLPFTVTIVAQNLTNGTVTNFTGNVSLSDTPGVDFTPAGSGAFVNGSWTGKVRVLAAATNLVLRCSDTNGTVALANAITVTSPPRLALQVYGNVALMLWPTGLPPAVVESSANLAPASWAQLPPPLQVGNQWAVPVEMTDSHRFYRIRF